MLRPLGLRGAFRGQMSNTNSTRSAAMATCFRLSIFEELDSRR
jgi:hypothetical protein